MKPLEWHFPESIEEAKSLVTNDGLKPCGGGTILIKTGAKGLQGLIGLTNLPLNFFREDDQQVEIGATCTFSEVVENLKGSLPQSILLKSLNDTASTPLRNIITIGGSVAAFPLWSDLMGPLIALDAEVALVGNSEGYFPISEYVDDSDLKKNSLIKGIRFEKNDWNSYYYRATRTDFEYSNFNLTLLWKRDGERFKDTRIVIVGNRKRFKRLTAIEERLKGKKIDEIEPKNIAGKLDTQFPPKKLGSPEYIKHLATVELERAIETIIKG